jgi:Tol biopolymer transport system component
MNTRRKIEKAALAASVMIAASGAALLGARAQTQGGREKQPVLRSTIAFVSTRHDPAADPAIDSQRAWLAAEIYLMDGDGTHPRRVTENAHFDCFPALSPDGKSIVFDSNRLRADGEPFNTSHLFVMEADGTGQTPLVRGNSATWSPDGRNIAFHASASGTGPPINALPGAATTDSDIFVLNVDDFLKKGTRPKNITNNPAAVDDDPDWSPRGQRIVLTSHAVTDNTDTSLAFPGGNHVTAEIYVRAPSWSPDGRRIVLCCRRGGPDFEICVMNADGTGQVQLTDNTIGDLGALVVTRWQEDRVPPAGGGTRSIPALLDQCGRHRREAAEFSPGLNGFPNWGEVRGRGPAK